MECVTIGSDPYMYSLVLKIHVKTLLPCEVKGWVVWWCAACPDPHMQCRTLPHHLWQLMSS